MFEAQLVAHSTAKRREASKKLKGVLPLAGGHWWFVSFVFSHEFSDI